MKVLVVTSRNHSASNRGIDVLIDYLFERKYDVSIYIYPISFSNREMINIKQKNHIYSKASMINYYNMFMSNMPLKLTRYLFNYIYIRTNNVNFEEYDLIVIESGYGVTLVDHIPEDKCIIYRQSDSIELIMTRNKYLIECEKNLMKRACVTLVPNSKIYDYYAKQPKFNISLWENGFLQMEDNISYDNPFENKHYNCVYMGLFPVDNNLLKELSIKHEDINFHIIGPQKNRINRDNVIYHGYLKTDEYMRYLTYCDFTIIPIRESEKLKYVGPTSKIYQFLSMKKPVISTDYGFLNILSSKTKDIYLCKTVGDFTNTIKLLVENNFYFYEDLGLSKYFIKNRKVELDNIFNNTVIKHDKIN